ncbi:hypothetical protein HMPREF3167_04565 [Trueperella sp. HMSC08B05]|uniref:carboxymuconolactone decarboxylase family protein n=1 Tax=Trueperella sp. HMSC08B05 TaxID=1581135 RepID=UPI0008A5BCE6|nr:carboxymuconolactone decarboxylase family protein [Trueperella sp. HMSC08B05]OFS74798.1 hypothetical protein HMPREF3167_04565 [Trueperella sp. HMSC08B05]
MTRIDIAKATPDVYKALNAASMKSREAWEAAGLTAEEVELAKVRVSQINGCVACLGVHVPALREAGMDQCHIDVLPAWRDAGSPFTPKQRAILELAEALTTLERPEARDAVIAAALEYFTPEQVSALEWSIILIGAYNRISIASGHRLR